MGSTHAGREVAVIEDLERSFPDFTGRSLSWIHNPDDPPDFLAAGPNGAVGLELREWLDGEQMNAAQAHYRQREHLAEIFSAGWEHEYQPKNFVLAAVEPLWGLRITKKDESSLRREFYECATTVDQTWLTNPERINCFFYQMAFSRYPTMQKYLRAIRYTSGPSHGCVWFQIEEDGGAYSPTASVQSLEKALDDKLLKFDRPEWRVRLAKHKLVEHHLLIHGGWNVYKNNTPHHPLTLEQIATRAADFYAAHPKRDLFDRVSFFDSLDSADDINERVGFPAGAGRIRWLAEIWPSLKVHAGSTPAFP
jgi:hypothetical protein